MGGEEGFEDSETGIGIEGSVGNLVWPQCVILPIHAHLDVLGLLEVPGENDCSELCKANDARGTTTTVHCQLSEVDYL